MILEAIVTTLNEDGSVNIAPMGPHVECPELSRFRLKPFNTSTTFSNLKRKGEGVLHITDDVLLISKAVIGELDSSSVPTVASSSVQGFRIADACRWFEFRVEQFDDSQERADLLCETVDSGNERPFWGFNRAKHAVLEGAILASRVSFLPIEEIQSQFDALKIIVQKTGGDQEHEAFDILQAFVTRNSAAKTGS